jgi:hypothetical protein
MSHVVDSCLQMSNSLRQIAVVAKQIFDDAHDCAYYVHRGKVMSLTIEKKRKHIILDQTKLSLAKKLLGAKTETETIEVALDSIISEAQKNKIAFAATERFFRSGIVVDDVFGNLEAD